MRFSLNIPNELGEKVIREASGTGRNKQRMWCHMAETYFDFKDRSFVDSKNNLVLYLALGVVGTLCLLSIWMALT